jgi:hypothetical protein
MPDDITIGTGVSPGTAVISADQVGGALVQRVKPAVGTDGTAVDVSATNPMPTTDAGVKGAVDAVTAAVAALDTQMGAAPAQTPDVQAVRDRLPAALDTAGGMKVTPTGTVTVDTELPAASALGDGDANAATPSVGARGQVWNELTSQWVRARGARTDGASTGAGGVQAAVPHVYDSTASNVAPMRSARSVADAESGASFPPAGNMLWSGTSWARERASYQETVLASAARTTFADSPTLRSLNFRGVLVRINVTAVPASPTTGIGIQVLGAGGVYPGIYAAMTGNAIKTTGAFFVLVYPGATIVQTGSPTLNNGGSAAGSGLIASLPIPDQFTVRVGHGTAGESYTYAVDVSYLT